MVRLLVYVLLVFALAAGFAWLADHPGTLRLTFAGYEVRTSVMVAAILVVAAAIAVWAVLALLRWLWRTPQHLGGFVAGRRRDRGYRALSRGMIAIGAGDAAAAGRSAAEARHYVGEEPLALLLAAQAAQLGGDPAAARKAFEDMLARPETRILGLRGLFVEANRSGDRAAARHFAETAVAVRPGIGWAASALLDYQAADGDWAGALQTLATLAESRAIDKARAQRLQAVLLTARAGELEDTEPEIARGLAYEAHRLAPDLVPAAVTASRLGARLGDLRRAARILEQTWKIEPHPDLAAAYASLRPGETAVDRLNRLKGLVRLRANHLEGVLAEARAAIDARRWREAREALKGVLVTHPSERACLMMAEIEEGEHGDIGRARDWLARAVTAPPDPAWIADGFVFDRWAPVSPISGRLDAFAWRAPVERHRGAAIEARPVATPGTALAVVAAPGWRAAPAEPIDEIEPLPEDAGPSRPPPAAGANGAAAGPGMPPPPDDPGPEPGPLDPERRRPGPLPS